MVADSLGYGQNLSQEGFKIDGLTEQAFLEEVVKVERRMLSDGTFSHGRWRGASRLIAPRSLQHWQYDWARCASGDFERLGEGRLGYGMLLIVSKSSVFKRQLEISMSLFQGSQ